MIALAESGICVSSSFGRPTLGSSGVISAALCLEAKAVCALAFGGVALMCANLDTVERAVVVGSAVILTALYGTSDMLVCKFSSHVNHPFR